MSLLANTGTPLMWATMLHLFLGNALIGLLEGLLLSWLFKAPKRRSVPILISANYVSASAGVFLFSSKITPFPDLTIETIGPWLVALVLIAFVITALFEYPFFWFILRKTERTGTVLKATLAVNGISYVLLVAWYWMASGTSMITRLSVAPVGELVPAGDYFLYYVTPDGQHVIHSNLAGNQRNEIQAAHAFDRDDRLLVRPHGTDRFDLLLLTQGDQEQKEQIISENTSGSAPFEEGLKNAPSHPPYGTWFNFGPVLSFVPQSPWKFSTGFWAGEGIIGTDAKGRKIRFSIETPFVSWIVRNATQIEDTLVVFQLGNDQICLLDTESKRIALLARGKGPAVIKPTQL